MIHMYSTVQLYPYTILVNTTHETICINQQSITWCLTNGTTYTILTRVASSCIHLASNRYYSWYKLTMEGLAGTSGFYNNHYFNADVGHMSMILAPSSAFSLTFYVMCLQLLSSFHAVITLALYLTLCIKQ